MADFKTLNGYTVKDPNAGRSLAVNGNQLSLKNAAGTAISNVTLPGGGGKAVIANVQVWSTPDQWQADEQLQFGYYADGNGTTLNAEDIAQYLADGAVPYIAYDGVYLLATDVVFDLSYKTFSFSATTTIADFNRVYTGMTPYPGSATNTFNITIESDGGIGNTATGNYSSSSGFTAYTWFNQQVSVPLLQVGQILDIAYDIGDSSFSANDMFATLDAGGFVSITLGGEIAHCFYVDEVYGGRKTAYFCFAEGHKYPPQGANDKWVSINDLGELCRTE